MVSFLVIPDHFTILLMDWPLTTAFEAGECLAVTRPGEQDKENLKGRAVLEGELEAGQSPSLQSAFPTTDGIC